MDFPPVPCFNDVSRCHEDSQDVGLTNVTPGEITTLSHESTNYTVELAAGIAESLFASAESAEVLSSLRDDGIVEVEDNASPVLS